jgi:hypothetical protein
METATVCVRLLAAALPSQGSGKESIEALVEVPWRDGVDEETIQRDALLRLQTLIRAEMERLDSATAIAVILVDLGSPSPGPAA